MLKNIFTSIDIGSDNVKVVTCELYNNKLNLLAASSIKSKGIKMGVIVNPNEASSAVKQALNEVESMLGIKIDKVIASVPSNFAEFTFIKGEIEITNEESIVTSKDIVEVMQIAMDSKLTADKEMVTILPIDFRLNDQDLVTNPLGRQTKTLSTRAIMVTTPKRNIYSVVSVLEDAGCDVIDIMINSIGNINSLKNKVTENKIGAIIDIGAETTNIALYNKNIIVKNSIINMGSKKIDDIIIKEYNLEPSDAKRIKEKFALAHKKFANVSDFYEVTNKFNEDVKINQYEISELCMNKLVEMIDLSLKELNNICGKELDYVIFTGGISMMSHFDYLLKEEYDKNASVGLMRIIGVRNNMYSAAIGNIIYFISKLRLKGKNYSMLNSNDMEQLSNRRNNTSVSNNSMLGKVVDYFFGE
ncbi:MAG TPA: cell division FtsA domain-containing protein [Bacilli bacterium]|nr:cell division FtsA domain-containing protein [Bacilli bacterium]